MNSVEKLFGLIQSYRNGSSVLKHAILSKVKKRVFKISPKYNNDFPKYVERITEEILSDVPMVSFDLINHYLRHEYNFLGTGWKCWSDEFVEGSYAPIKWNIDIKSGYIFKDNTMLKDMFDRLPKGVDVKIPWELGRMYHWPQMALYAYKNKGYYETIKSEFVNQMNDFMVSNPIGKGVQFYCPMEVAIRGVNMTLAYDIFKKLGDFSEEFHNQLCSYLYNQGQYVLDNLEYNFFAGTGGNHYLSNLCGLLWLDMYFPTNRKFTLDLKQEFEKAISVQFLEDGSNFEGSSCYHKLTTEIVAIGTLALEVILGEESVHSIKQTLLKMMDMLEFFTARDGRLIQIGDNDSGRIVKIVPLYNGDIEDTINPSEIFMLTKYALGYVGENFTREIIPKAFDYKSIIDFLKYTKKSEFKLKEKSVTFCIKERRDFGLIKIVYDNEDIFIRSMPKYDKMIMGHIHDDVFSYQIIDKKKRIREDLGSIAYTPDKEVRWHYASGKAHGVPIHSRPMINRIDTFVADTNAVGETYVSEDKIAIYTTWSGIEHLRVFNVDETGIVIEDYSNEDFDIPEMMDKEYSLGYGQLGRL